MNFLSFVPQDQTIDYERIDRMQKKMTDRKASICPERAEIITEVFRETEDDPMIVRRAKAFARILEKMSIYIEEDALIVGNQASANFAAPVFPEYSYEWVIEELDDFEKRSGDMFYISEDTKCRLKALAPYWTGKTHADEVQSNMPKTVQQAQTQNVIHCGGISMSGDGHIIPNHELILEKGYGGLKKIAEENLRKEGLTQEQKEFYEAAVISLGGVLSYIKRYSVLAAEMAKQEENAKRREELLTISTMCVDLMEGGARSFYEAVETIYLTHLLMMIESNGHSFSFGRFDQYIYPYYENDVNAGLINKDKALEIITHFYIMTNSINKVRPWGHTQYSAGYPLYSNLILSGLRSDGTDGTNDLSYLCLEAMSLNRLPEPNLSMRYHGETPRSLIVDAAKLIRTGFGQPSLFADDVVIPALQTLDIDIETARDYASMGCVEVAIPGRWGHRATGMTYINFGKIMELVMNNGYDPASGVQVISISGKPGRDVEYQSYDDVWDAWQKLLKFYTDLAVECDLVCDRSLKYYDSDSFASSLVDCCLERGKTLKNGGAKYDYVSQSNIGMSVVGDGLAVLKKLVFEDKVITMEQLRSALDNNWEGLEGLNIRKLCRNVPKFGNDDDYVDMIVAAVFDSYLELLPGYQTDRAGRGPIGCGYTMSTSNISSYVPNGMDVGATPDGRFTGSPLNEGASPCLGADINGPTSVINSVAKLPNKRMAGGQLLNMRFSPGLLEGDDNLDKFVSFLEVTKEKNIFHNQFNIIDSDTLRAAKENPETHGNLMVRVAGYCALFTSLMPEAQDAIIARTEYGANH